MKLTPATRLIFLGVIIFAALLTTSRMPGGAMGRYYLVPLTIAGAAYLLAVRELFAAPQYSRQIIFACLALAAVWRVPFLLQPTAPQDDLLRYVWDGRVQHHGYNPYRTIPSDPSLAALHTAETRGMNNADVPSPYPAGAQLFFRAVTAIHESILAFKIAFVFCDLAIVLLLLNILRRNGEAEHWVLAYAWHPLVAIHVVGSGHVDILGVLLLLVSAAALTRRWRLLAAIAFAFAVAVKFLPIVLAPLYWRRVRIRDAFVAALAFVGLYLPFLRGWRAPGWHLPIGSIGTFLQRFRFNDPVFGMLQHLARPQLVAAVALTAGLATAAWFRRKPESNGTQQWAWPMAASLLCAPVVYPWYLLWLLPFLRSLSTVPLIVWSISILPTYIVWYLRSRGYEWYVPTWALWLEYGSVAVAGVIVVLRPTVQINLAHPAPDSASLAHDSPDDPAVDQTR